MESIKFHLFREVSPAAIASGYSSMGANERKPTAVHIDRKNGWVIQVWTGISATPGCVGTPWEGTARICVQHSKAKSLNEFHSRKHDIPITWDELQAIKDWLFPGRIALEVYPPKDKIVNVANMRWLWVLPAGACLPFNLQAASVNRLES